MFKKAKVGHELFHKEIKKLFSKSLLMQENEEELL